MTLDERLAAVWREAERIGVGVVRGDPGSMIAAMSGATMSILGAQAQASQLKGQAQAANYNAAVERQQGQQAMEAATSKEAQSLRSSDAALGSAAAGVAQSGIGIQSASAQNVLRQDETQARLDALNINYEGQLEKRNYAINAQTFDAQASMSRSQASNALTMGYVGAGLALVNGAAGSYGKYQAQSTGPGSTGGGGITPPGTSSPSYGSWARDQWSFGYGSN